MLFEPEHPLSIGRASVVATWFLGEGDSIASLVASFLHGEFNDIASLVVSWFFGEDGRVGSGGSEDVDEVEGRATAFSGEVVDLVVLSGVGSGES